MRYFLHIWTGKTRIEDLEGAEYPDLAAARREAVRGVRDLLAERLKRGDVLDGQSIEICDENDRLVDTILFRDELRLPKGD
ncbi:DUF6894 family protein [Aureimonas pseudogalii]|uniref:DUF6894 family protein n=1 Tax=Aureimonas pseudogalii TaxID=1744844 RepID=UPI0016067338|nr:hypothetical protein [Aureimonas pseudogalii]